MQVSRMRGAPCHSRNHVSVTPFTAPDPGRLWQELLCICNTHQSSWKTWRSLVFQVMMISLALLSTELADGNADWRESSETHKSLSVPELAKLVLNTECTSPILKRPQGPPFRDGIPQGCLYRFDNKYVPLSDVTTSSNCGAWNCKGNPSKHYYIDKSDSGMYNAREALVKFSDSGRPLNAYINVRKGSKYVREPVSLDSVYKVTRAYAEAKNNTFYRRNIITLKQIMTNSLERIYLCHYFWLDGETGCWQLRPHGNSKTDRPYIATQSSKMEDMKTKLETSNPATVYKHQFTASGGVLHSESASAEPRNRTQIYNINRSRKLAERSSDWLSAVIRQQQEQRVQGDPYVRNIKLGENPMGVNFTQQQLTDIERFCTNPRKCSILSIDMTYNLGDFYVTNTVFENLSLISCRTGKHPTFKGPDLVHFSKDEEAFQFLASEMVGNNPLLKNIQFFGTDDDPATYNGFKKGIGGNIGHLLCHNHMKDNIKRKLSDLKFPLSVAREIEHDIFGKQVGDTYYKGLVDAENECEFQETLLILGEKWNEMEKNATKNVPPLFYSYFIKSKAEKIMTKMIQPVREKAGLGIPAQPYTQNRVESMNKLSKLQGNWDKHDWATVNEQQFDLVKMQYEEATKAIYKCGQYRLSEEYRSFEVEPNVWHGMMADQRKKHLKKFLSAPLVVEPMLTEVPSHVEPSGVKLSISSSQVNLPLSANTINKIWKNAEKIIQNNGVTKPPGAKTDDSRIVIRNAQGESSSDKGSPFVHVIYSKGGKMECECQYFKSMHICEHTVAAAEDMNVLRQYVEWAEKNKRNPVLSALYRGSLPKGAGKKPGQRSRQAKSKPDIEHVVDPLPVNMSHPFTEYYHNNNPFIVVFVDEVADKKALCPTCNLHFATRVKIKPFDLILKHKERYLYPDKANIWVPTRYQTRDVFYHLQLQCVQPRHPYFKNSFILISDDVKGKLDTSHKQILKQEFDLNLL
ncbi:uncharacterized protein [Ptychodera flava]|uniref:uncharacterized protein isoform X2 n=1 Tax=Ptychodera flava TaxID=63121 RepID=UPI00396A06E8